MLIELQEFISCEQVASFALTSAFALALAVLQWRLMLVETFSSSLISEVAGHPLPSASSHLSLSTSAFSL